MIHSVVIREKPPSKRPRIQSNCFINYLFIRSNFLAVPVAKHGDIITRLRFKTFNAHLSNIK